MSEEGQVETLAALRRIAGIEARDGTERVTMDQFRDEIGAPPRGENDG